MSQVFNINALSNRIHEWGEPEQSPLKAMGFPRVGSVALAALEAINALYNSLLVVTRLPITLFNRSISVYTLVYPKNVQLQKIHSRFSPYCISKVELLRITKIIVGLASTIFFGVVFSPEVNFRLHQKLGLVEDNTVLRKIKALKAKLESETRREALNSERALRLAQFQKERQKSQIDETMDANLAELFTAYLK